MQKIIFLIQKSIILISEGQDKKNLIPVKKNFIPVKKRVLGAIILIPEAPRDKIRAFLRFLFYLLPPGEFFSLLCRCPLCAQGGRQTIVNQNKETQNGIDYDSEQDRDPGSRGEHQGLHIRGQAQCEPVRNYQLYL